MATDIERLAVLIEANTKAYENAMRKLEQKTDQTVRRLERSFKDSGDKLEAMFSGLGQRLGSALSVAGVIAGINRVREALKDMAEIADISERVGVSTDMLQALRFTVAQNGGEAADAGNALEKFAEGLGEASAGGGYLAKVLQANNVSLKDSSGNLRSVDDMLGEYARLVAGASSQQEKMMLVTEAFGRRAGPQMLLALEEISSKGLPGVMQASRDAGVIIDKQLIAKAREFDDAWDKAMTQLSAGTKSAVVTALDQVKKMVDDINSNLDRIGTAPSQIDPEAEARAAQAAREAAATATARKVRRQPAPELPQMPADGTLSGETGLFGVLGRTPPPAPKRTVIPSRAENASNTVGVDSFARAVSGVEKRIEVLKAETDTIGMNTAARERAKVVAELETAAKSANAAAGLKNTEVTTAQRAEIEKAADAMLVAEQNNYRLTQSFQAQNDVLRFAGEQAVDVIRAISGTAEDRLRALQGVLNSLMQALLKAAVLGEGPLAGILGTKSSVSGGVGGILGAIASSFGKSGAPGAPLSLAPPGRAMGGSVTGGKPYIVGERQPELFVPSSSGRIVPKLGGSTEVNIYNAPPDTRVERTNRPDGGQLVDVFLSAAKKDMAQGGFDSALKSRQLVTARRG